MKSCNQLEGAAKVSAIVIFIFSKFMDIIEQKWPLKLMSEGQAT